MNCSRLTAVVAALSIGMLAGTALSSGTALGKRPVLHSRSLSGSKGVVAGQIELCGGPAPAGGRCHTAKRLTACARGVCRTLDRAVVKTSSGNLVKSTHITRGRFRLPLSPGQYVVEVVWTARQASDQFAAAHRLTVRAHRTTHTVFRFFAG